MARKARLAGHNDGQGSGLCAAIEGRPRVPRKDGEEAAKAEVAAQPVGLFPTRWPPRCSVFTLLLTTGRPRLSHG